VLSAALGINLPLSGRLGLETDLADERFLQARTQARLVEARALDDIDRAWMRWSLGRRRAALSEELTRTLAELESTAQRLATAGALTRLEVQVFTMERVAREGESIRAKADVDTAELELKRLLGLPPQSSLAFRPLLRIPELVADADSRRSRLPLGREVVRAERAHFVAERELALAIAGQWPDFQFFPGWQHEDGQGRAAFGFTLPLPIWNANARGIAEARAQRMQADRLLRGALERSFQDLAIAEVRVDAARRERALVEGQLIPLAEDQLARGRELATLGELDVLLILDAVLRVFDAQSAVLEATLAESLAIVDLNAWFWPELEMQVPIGPAEEKR
jgi:outer membrane protein TolC